MSLDCKEISQQLAVGERHLQNLTKKANDAGLSCITCKGEQFTFSKVAGIGGRGWVYSYEAIINQAQKPKRKVCNVVALNPTALPTFADLNKPTTDEKLAIVSFYNVSKHPLSHIVKALIIENRSNLKPSSLQAKIKRWIKAFKEQGRSGLEDKRGGKAFKADLNLIEQAILGAGSVHDITAFTFYCSLYAKKHNLAMNYRAPVADISESAFRRTANHVINNSSLVKEYLRLGQDAFIYAEPSVGRQWDYPNEQWEVDATPCDIMAKVPVSKAGIRDYWNLEASEDYHLVRMQIIGIIDNFSGATVYALFESSNSYANARLLYKAFEMLGMPETIKGDNGADYVSAHLQSVLVDLGINYIATGKARGDEKGKIERSFRTLQHSAEFESLAGFIGHNVSQRQKLESQASTKIEKLSGVATNIKGDHMWHWELSNWLDNFMQHKQQDRFAQHAEFPANKDELLNIYRLLGKRTAKTVSKEGIRHRNTHYLSFEMWQHIAIGDRVEIIEHIDDSSILFLYHNAQFVCEIQDKNIFRQGMTVEAIKANKKAYKQRVVKDVKRKAKQAQKDYRGYQNSMRDEYLDLETAQVELKKELEKDEANYADEFMAFALNQA